MTTDQTYDYLIKLVLIGDSGVGKSSLLTRFADDCFSSSFITTIGIDFRIKTITLDGKKYKLQLWDTAGQERFRSITASYYRRSNGILLVYDVTNETSFNNIKNWMIFINKHAQVSVNKLLIGNKCDLVNQQIITTDRGKALAKQYEIEFLETSAKNNCNVEEMFITITKDIQKRLIENPNVIIQPLQPLPPLDTSPEKVERCC